jgi:hypothetical protein
VLAEVVLKEEINISGFKDLYKFFMTLKARKCSFYVSFGDGADQNLADYRLQDVVYEPGKLTSPSNNDVALVLEPLSEPDFKAIVEAQDNLRVEFFHEGRVNYFDIQVGVVSSFEYGLGFSAKLPDQVSVKAPRDILHLPAARDATISMNIGGQPVDVVDLSGGGASVLIPQANLNDIEIGKAIRHIVIKVDGFEGKASAEVRNMRFHANGLKLVVGLRFIFFGSNDEDELLHLVKKKSASLSRKEAISS